MIALKFQYTLCGFPRFVITYIEYIPTPSQNKFFLFTISEISEYINEPNLISEMEMSLANVVIISIENSFFVSFVYLLDYGKKG